MMRRSALFLILILCASQVSAQLRGRVYVFGIGDSMRDSTVYFTGIQCIDSANIQKHTKFLLDRGDFALQLKQYFVKSGDVSRLCIIYPCKSEKEAAKKRQKVKSRYLDDGMLVKQIPDFKFSPMPPIAVGRSKDKETDNTVE